MSVWRKSLTERERKKIQYMLQNLKKGHEEKEAKTIATLEALEKYAYSMGIRMKSVIANACDNIPGELSRETKGKIIRDIASGMDWKEFQLKWYNTFTYDFFMLCRDRLKMSIKKNRTWFHDDKTILPTKRI